MRRAESLCVQGGCIYIFRLQPLVKSAVSDLHLDFETCSFTSKKNLSLVRSKKSSALTAQCKLPIKFCAVLYKELKPVKDIPRV